MPERQRPGNSTGNLIRRIMKMITIMMIIVNIIMDRAKVSKKGKIYFLTSFLLMQLRR